MSSEPWDAAAAAGEIARQATLTGAEALALCRQAEALRRRGAGEALDRSRQAVAILDAQQTIEGSEEEILFTHHRLLAEVGDAAADQVLRRAREGFERKLALLTRPPLAHLLHRGRRGECRHCRGLGRRRLAAIRRPHRC